MSQLRTDAGRRKRERREGMSVASDPRRIKAAPNPRSADWHSSSKPAVSDERWNLRLYVAGETPKCVQAFEHLKRICEEHLQGRYTIEVIDLLKNPTLASGDQIIAIPTLVRQLPPPVK